MTEKPVILIVDDTPEYLLTLANCLKEYYLIKVATNGKKCLKIAQSDSSPDLILLDVVMPEMDGYQVITELKSNKKTAQIPVIFVTSNDEEEEEEKGLQLGAVDYIAKPFRPTIVRARVRTHIILKKQRDELSWLAMRDPLTSLFNRHYLLEAIKQKMSHASRHEESLCLLAVDLDHFKQINDKYGHVQGDHVLQDVASILRDNCRNEDIAARIGGEEFAVVLDHCDLELAEKKAESLRNCIETRFLNALPVTASIGVAKMETGDKSFDDLFNRADKALYSAKEHGRNRVIVARRDLQEC